MYNVIGIFLKVMEWIEMSFSKGNMIWIVVMVIINNEWKKLWMFFVYVCLGLFIDDISLE